MADIEKSIADCCKQLRLSSNFSSQAITQKGASQQEYLLNLLTNEIEYRLERRKSKYLNTAGFPRRYAVDEFRTDEIDFPDGAGLENLLNLISITQAGMSSCMVAPERGKQCFPSSSECLHAIRRSR